MNICFAITDKYEYEFTSNNLIKSDMMIESIRIVANENVIGTAILLDAVNNMQERKQSPLVVVNEVYQKQLVNGAKSVKIVHTTGAFRVKPDDRFFVAILTLPTICDPINDNWGGNYRSPMSAIVVHC